MTEQAGGGNPGKDGGVTSGQNVLVVDDTTDTAEVLRAVLEPRGVSIEHHTRGALLPAKPPATWSLVVVDQDSATRSGLTGQEWRDLPRVIIGHTRTASPADQPLADRSPQRFLRKPFHYADLIREIESLIGRTAADDAAVA
ncbi:MAG: hypothetical protein ACKV0T_19770 [Planctomycetales bacterium]